MRLFTGISIPTQIRQELLRLCGGIPRLRWQEEQRMHITLHFLGELDDSRYDPLLQYLQQIPFEEFLLQFQGVNLFGELNKPKVLFAEVAPNEELEKLQMRGKRILSDAGYSLENRSYKPHVTLARPKAQIAPESTLDWLKGGSFFQSTPFEVKEFHLFESFLTPHGPEYEILESFPL